MEIINNGTVKKKNKSHIVQTLCPPPPIQTMIVNKIKQFKNRKKKKTRIFYVNGPDRKADQHCQRLNGLKIVLARNVLNITIFVGYRSESEVKDVCLSASNNCGATSQNGNEDTAAAAAVQSGKPAKTQQNQRQSNQNHRYHRPPTVVTDEEYSDSSGGLYNDFVSNNSVSTSRKITVLSVR